MQLLECDAKTLLSRHAIVSPPGIVAATPEETEAAELIAAADKTRRRRPRAR